ncbi:MAG: DUF308 domain-containing protein [Muribaculaceae bacterium]|nr:DUF308 domain-containing protein [Muribaculaceae bacterium]
MERNDLFYRATKFWWIPMIVGLVFIGFGVWCLCNPGPSLTIMAYIFAGALGAVGIVNLIYGFANTRNNHGWGWSVACGIIEILCSVWLFFLPGSSLVTAFIFCAGLYIIFVAVNAISESFVMYNYSTFWSIWLFLLLLCSVVCSCIFLAGPIVGTLAVWLYIGISFITYGVSRVIFSIRINQINNRFNQEDPE